MMKSVDVAMLGKQFWANLVLVEFTCSLKNIVHILYCILDLEQETKNWNNTVRGVLFMTLYFHEFHENCVIRENLICELQYLWWNVLWAIETKKEVREILNVNYQFVKISHREKYPVYGTTKTNTSNKSLSWGSNRKTAMP